MNLTETNAESDCKADRIDTMADVLKERIQSRISIDDKGCWIWQGTTTSEGYGQTIHQAKKLYTHRLAYELWRGQIHEGLVIDHLCRNRACCNPGHLEVVSRGMNALRGVGSPAVHAVKTHCLRGHEFTPDNTYTPTSSPNHRNCRTCRADAKRRHYIKERAALGKVTKYGA